MELYKCVYYYYYYYYLALNVYAVTFRTVRREISPQAISWPSIEETNTCPLLGRSAVLRTGCYWRSGVACCLSVCLSVGLSVTIVSLAKTAEPIDMSFGTWTPVGPWKRVLDGCTLAPPSEYD